MESLIDNGKYVLTLTELHQLYINRLQDFGIKKEVNRTSLKSRILTHFPGKLQEQSDGKTVLLVFNEGMASILREELWKHDYGELSPHPSFSWGALTPSLFFSW